MIWSYLKFEFESNFTLLHGTVASGQLGSGSFSPIFLSQPDPSPRAPSSASSVANRPPAPVGLGPLPAEAPPASRGQALTSSLRHMVSTPTPAPLPPYHAPFKRVPPSSPLAFPAPPFSTLTAPRAPSTPSLASRPRRAIGAKDIIVTVSPPLRWAHLFGRCHPHHRSLLTPVTPPPPRAIGTLLHRRWPPEQPHRREHHRWSRPLPRCYAVQVSAALLHFARNHPWGSLKLSGSTLPLVNHHTIGGRAASGARAARRPRPERGTGTAGRLHGWARLAGRGLGLNRPVTVPTF
jgi:hypothetical protein